MATWKEKAIRSNLYSDIQNNLVWFKYDAPNNFSEQAERYDGSLEYLLNYEFDDDFGSPEGLSFVIITNDWVYFPSSYDGAEDIERVPRNPNNNYCPEHIGGW